MIKYLGGGFLYGIPARDLTADEWAALSDEQRQAAVVSGLYQEPETAETKRGKK